MDFASIGTPCQPPLWGWQVWGSKTFLSKMWRKYESYKHNGIIIQSFKNRDNRTSITLIIFIHLISQIFPGKVPMDPLLNWKLLLISTGTSVPVLPTPNRKSNPRHAYCLSIPLLKTPQYVVRGSGSVRYPWS